MGKYTSFFLTVAVLLMLQVSGSSAFDGRRNGFIFGGGFTEAVGSHWSLDGFEENDTYNAPGYNFLFGWSFGESITLAWHRETVYADSESPFSDVGVNWVGPRVGYFFRKPGSTLFAEFGVGWLRVYSYSNVSNTGVAVSISAGYEFVKHIQFISTYVRSKLTNEEIDSTHGVLMLSARVVVF